MKTVTAMRHGIISDVSRVEEYDDKFEYYFFFFYKQYYWKQLMFWL